MSVLSFVGPILGRRETDPRYCVLCCAGSGLAGFVSGLFVGTIWPL